METILVTGGAGYVGSHTCKALADAGYLPVTVDNFVSGHDWAVRWGPVERGDIRDTSFLLRTMRKHEVSAVIHFAALSLVGQSFTDPGHYYDVNVGGTLSLLSAMQAADIRTLVFSSSCAVYGIPERLPIAETAIRNPINPYGRSKAATEALLGDFAQAHRFNIAAMRYFNAAGADLEGGIGEAHTPETHLIPLVIQTALGQRGAIDIFGTDYDTPDGTCLRDYIHVNDLARAHLAALSFLQAEEGFHAFNLGNGRAHSVREVISTVEGLTGKPISSRLMPRRPGDPATLFADSAKARATLNWQPVQSDLEAILESAIFWHQEFLPRLTQRKAS